MFGTLKEQEKTHWKDFVKPLVQAYNCTRNNVTGFSPYELMFGRQPRLPVDLAFGLPVTEKKSTSHSQYVEQLKSHLEDSYKIAVGNAEKVMCNLMCMLLRKKQILFRCTQSGQRPKIAQSGPSI